MSAQVDAWRDIYRERVVEPDPDPMLIVGAKRHYLMAETKEPFRDYTGGGGVMPMGHGQEQVSESIQELAKYFYQTGPDTVQGIQMEFLLWLGKHFSDGWRYQFYASENEALHGVAEAMGAYPEQVAWVNRMVPLSDMESWNPTQSGIPNVAVVAAVDPETYRPLSKGHLETAYGWHEQGVKIVWDETVAGMGWRGTTVFNTPFWADAVVLGGAVGGGIPLGVIGGANLRPIREAGRLAGSGIAMTAGLHTLRQLMVATAHSDAVAMVERLVDKLAELKDKNRFIHDVTGEGLLRSLRLPSDRIAREFVVECRRGGALLTRSGEYVKISMPLVCTQRDVDELVDIMIRAMMRVQDGHE